MIEFLDKMRLFKDRLKYIKQFKPIGRGSSRLVFDYEEGVVLKVAKNKFGVIQNIKESSIGYKTVIPILAPIEGYSPYGYWVLQKKVTPIVYAPKLHSSLDLKEAMAVLGYSKQYDILNSSLGMYRLLIADISLKNLAIDNGNITIFDYGL